MAREEPLYYIPTEPLHNCDAAPRPGGTSQGEIQFILPLMENKTKHNQFMRDMERLQWFAIGHGYIQTPEHWIGKFEPEEYNCVLRYLNKFGWAPAETCKECGTVVENKSS